jgi:uncharacterized repeat protein (TIGR01451 family)
MTPAFTTTSVTDDPVPNNNTVSVPTAITPSADLSTVIEPDNEYHYPGDTVTYTVSVINNGPATAATPSVSFAPPPQLTDAAYSTDGGQTWRTWPGSLTLEDIPNGVMSQFLLQGTIDPRTTGTVTATMTTTSPTNDPKTENNTADTTTNIIPVADLDVTATSDKENPKPGDTVTYTVNVHNYGPATAANPIVVYDPPLELDNVEYSTDGGQTWKLWPGNIMLDDIPDGDTTQFLVRGTVDQYATNAFDNMFQAASDDSPNNNTANVTTAVTDTADLVTTVTPDNPKPAPGDVVTYTISIVNDGSATSKSPTIIAFSSPELTNLQYSTDSGATWQTWLGTLALADIPNGDTSQFKIKGTIDPNASGEITPTFTAANANNDPSPSNNTATVPTADLKTTITTDNPNPLPGDTVNYTVSVINNGPVTAATPNVSFTPPAALTNVQYSTDGGILWQPWTGDLTLNDIPNRDVSQLLLQGTVAKDAADTITPTVTAVSPTNDPNTTDNTASVQVAVVPSVDLVTTIVPDNDAPKPEDTVTLTVTVKNNGPATAVSPTVTYAPPPSLTDAEYTTDGGLTWQPWLNSLTLNDIPNGETDAFLIRGTVADTATGILTQTITAVSPTNELAYANNSATVESAIVPQSDIAATVSADNNNPKPGDTVTYTVSVQNKGPAAATAPKVSFAPSSGLTNVQYSTDGGLTWVPWLGNLTLNNMPNEMISQLLVKGMVDQNATGTITSTFNATSQNIDLNPANNTAAATEPIADTADLTVTVTPDKTNAQPGDTVTYNVNVHNNGPAAAATPTVAFNPPPALRNVEYSADGGLTWRPWTGSETLSDIPNGGTTNRLIRGVIDPNTPGSVITPTFTATSPTIEPKPADNTVTVPTTVGSVSDLVTTVTADNNNPQPGDTVTYTVSVQNKGPAAATAPKVSFAPPLGLTNVQYSTDGGVTWHPWSGNLTLNDMPNGDTSKLLVKGTVDQNATGTITSTFNAASPNADPNPANNTAANNAKVTDSANLITTMTVDNPNPKPGDMVVYTVSVSNSGPATVKSPTVTEHTPKELSNVEYSVDGGLSWQP